MKVNSIRRYQTFDAMLATEPYERIAPDSKSREEVLSLLKQIYPEHKEKLGVVVLEFTRPGK